MRNEATGKVQQRWANEVPNNGIIRFLHIFNEEWLLITGTKALAEVLTTNNYDFVKPAIFAGGLGKLLGVGVFLAEGNEHRLQRKNLMPAFSYRHIKDLYPIFWAKSSELVEAMSDALKAEGGESNTSLSKSPIQEMTSWSSRSTLDIIGTAGMGQDFGAIKDPTTEMNATYRKVFQSSGQVKLLRLLTFILPGWIVDRIPVRRNYDIPAATRTIRRICRQLIEQKKETLASKEPSGVDIISIALSSGGFTDDNLVDQMMTFLVAGHETTSTAMTWAIYSLCKHPQYQTRLREEIRTHFPSISDPNTPITAEQFDRLHFLHAVCNEVLRLHPPITLTLRQAAKPTTIAGHRVPKGTTIMISPAATNTTTSLWGPDAEEFRPERWLNADNTVNNSGGASSNYAFLPFLHGPRSCIGQAFAKAEFAVLVAGLVGRFEFELAEPDRVMRGAGMIARPRFGMKVRMREVEGWR
ncbi:MAG: hypothetical protein LQ350_007442 [Teloschistes chrysophthalmus]|nr:MAG: hypothetical protein LQ350_007442 [Niorma chrysophthalma]